MALDLDDDGQDWELEDDAPLSEPLNGKRSSGLLAQMALKEGDVSDLIDEDALARVGARALEEFDLDKQKRGPWEETIQRALAAAKQGDDKIAFPFEDASNVKLPVLTTAAIQFGSRAYGALVRDDQVVKPKVIGPDPQGMKASLGERVATFTNYQLMHLCDEWEPGTDMLCHQLPIVGTGFRKVYWKPGRNRPVLETTSALSVYVPLDAANLDQAPRVTQRLTYYPYEIAQNIASGLWQNHAYTVDSQDSQAPIEYLEQYRYEDLDKDGLPEPYVVTLHKETSVVVRMEPAFDPRHLRVWESGAGDALVRDMPWIDYGFLPNPEGGFYSIGFGHLLEPLQKAINALINQIIDAGTRANAGGGFLSQALKLRAGVLKIKPGEYHPINAPQGNVSGAIHTLSFPGPSATQFETLSFLLGMAKEITATADVLTGDMPNQQHVAEGTVLALIEQGLQVFVTIYKRLYRSERRCHRRLFGLNADFLGADVYRQVVDVPADPRRDFDLRGVDVMPVSDPATVSDMQLMARANFLAARAAARPDLYNADAVEDRVLQSARIPAYAELRTSPQDPARQLAARNAQAEVQGKEAKARKDDATAADTFQKAQGAALERGLRSGELAGVAGAAGDADVPPQGAAPAG